MNKNDILLSVIIPIYNAEGTIEECIDSVLNQSYTNFELILVDDGSADFSFSICKRYQKDDKRIKIVQTENKGIFQARKTGASISEGKYLTFLDSDDWIEQGAFEFAISIILSNADLDIMTYAFRFDKAGEIEENLYDEGIYEKHEIEEIIQKGMMFDHEIGRRRLNPSLCTKFIKKSLYLYIVNGIDDYITFGEDALVSYTAVCMSQKIGIYNNPFYHYRINEKSCMHRFPIERIEQINWFQKRIREQIGRTKYLPILDKQIDCYTRSFLRVLINNWFNLEYTDLPYVFSKKELIIGKKVALYGAGNVGLSFAKELLIGHYAQLVVWVDKDFDSKIGYMNVEIEDIEKLRKTDFDYLILALYDKVVAMEAKENLVNNVGIPIEKIIWEEPVLVG